MNWPSKHDHSCWLGRKDFCIISAAEYSFCDRKQCIWVCTVCQHTISIVMVSYLVSWFTEKTFILFQLLDIVSVIWNSADTDEMTHCMASHLHLHCLLTYHFWDARHKWFNKVNCMFNSFLATCSSDFLLSANNLCKQFGPRSGPMFCWSDQDQCSVGPDMDPNHLTL